MSFPTTRWSLLADATLSGGGEERAALGEFYRRYREPLVRFVARQPGLKAAAEDLTQEFFVHLIEHSTLRRAERARGRFRSFLLGALMRFLAGEREHAGAVKRGGGAERVPLETAAQERAEGWEARVAEAGRSFDREWARGLLERAQAEVAAAWGGREAEFAVLRLFLPGAPRTPSYAEAAEKLGWPLARLKTEIFRLREHLRERLRAEVALTVETPHEVQAEIAHLRAVLADPGS